MVMDLGIDRHTRKRAAPARCSIALFDGMRVSVDGRAVEVRNRKAMALLTTLLLNQSLSETRARLCGLLWSESSEENARSSLRQTLHGLKESLERAGFLGLHVSREQIGLDRDRVDVDLWAVFDAAERGETHPLLLEPGRLENRLFNTIEDVDPEFSVFAKVHRNSLAQKLERKLSGMLATARSSTETRRVATALIGIDPTNEAAVRSLMSAHAELGDLPAALRTYKALWDLLDDDFDMEPSDETRDLVVRIKTGEVGPRPSRFAAVSPMAGPAIALPAVVPLREPRVDTVIGVGVFDHRGVPEDQTYLVHGLRHELIARLVRFRDWTVFDWAEAGAQPMMPRARIFTIDATARPVASGVGITLTIKEAPGARYIWSEHFKIALVEWFDLQQTLVRRIAMALNVHVSAERMDVASRGLDVEPGVYDRWLRGHQLLFSWRTEDQTKAMEMFRSIIKDAPEFAPAYTSLVQYENTEHIVFPGVFRDQDKLRDALNLAKIAVKCDPFDSRAHLCLAWAYSMNKQYEQAKVSYDMALELNENDPWVLISAAQGMAFCGEPERAAMLAAQALSMDPRPTRSHWAYQVGIRFLTGDYAGCVDAAGRAGDIIPNLPAWKAAALAHLGDRTAAVAEATRFLSEITRNWHGTVPGDPETIYRWLLQCFPIKQTGDLRRLRNGLHAADPRVPEIGAY